MLKLSVRLALSAGLAFSCLASAPAHAQSPVTFVSGRGTDAGTCAAPTTPCRTFQYALALTNAGGEIKTLDPANYFFVTINKSINITGVDGAGIVRGTAGAAVTIIAGTNGVVSLSNLTIDGVNRTATDGVVVNSAGWLTVRNCTVRNFSDNGVHLVPTTALKFLLADVVASGNDGNGVTVVPQGGGSAQGVLDHVAAVGNLGALAGGVALSGDVDVAANDSLASNNATHGFLVNAGATLRLVRSTATKNSTGVHVFPPGVARSAGNNFINGNTTNIFGTLTNDGTQ